MSASNDRTLPLPSTNAKWITYPDETVWKWRCCQDQNPASYHINVGHLRRCHVCDHRRCVVGIDRDGGCYVVERVEP